MTTIKDFALQTQHLIAIYDCSKDSAKNRMFSLKKKLGKPAGGIILASEFCMLRGISIHQLSSMIKGENTINILQ